MNIYPIYKKNKIYDMKAMKHVVSVSKQQEYTLPQYKKLPIVHSHGNVACEKEFN